MKENSFSGNLQRDELHIIDTLENSYFVVYAVYIYIYIYIYILHTMHYMNNFSKKVS